MAKFFGGIGFVDHMEEPSPGVKREVLVERQFYGDVLQNNRQLKEGEKLNFDISVGNEISIVADAYANEHFFAMRYIRWAGSLWTAQDVVVQRPRIIVRLGGVYNGPVAVPTDA